jgi:hypothetical protein
LNNTDIERAVRGVAAARAQMIAGMRSPSAIRSRQGTPSGLNDDLSVVLFGVGRPETLSSLG